jgi:periplasmic divalent cation tolerance protein
MSVNEFIEIKTTFPDERSAKEFSSEAVGRRYAACSQLTSIHSYFHWKGALEESDEILASFKTTTDLRSVLEKFILENHPYETPEIWIIGPCTGSRQYLEWISRSVSTSGHESES